ncbi:unnamed protein product [Oppiella nova]|uniref:Caspase family p20 domain-containing protein n=1 Tax=Oppiella nova TaxID=334625 RepID=A0A7R9QRL2_9ACAR|nr:unnamed protein product [Oppiella nova]CAG2171764.1 unnamed protein product [Oppiella nova]
MESIPRGKAFIFVAVKELLNEAKRFASVYRQLYFDVEIHLIQNCQQMVSPLQIVANQAYQGNALIVMYIGHGYDEKIWINDGEEQRICNIVDIFSVGKCDNTFSGVPKIFVFNCCRNIGYHVTDDDQIFIDMSPISRNWHNNNTRTYICYTCSEEEFEKSSGQRPEIRQFMVTRDLYFNPGQPENIKNYVTSVKLIEN